MLINYFYKFGVKIQKLDFNAPLSFIKIGLSLSKYCEKKQNFRAPIFSGGWGRSPRPQNSPPSLHISGYAPANDYATTTVQELRMSQTDVKGGESSSLFRWFTIAKIEL